MLDRSQHPPIQEIVNLRLKHPEKIHLSNGIPVYAINMGTQAVVKIEIIFHAGRPYEEKALVARATASMLKEGTNKHSSLDIAEKVDFYGGTLSTPVNLDTSNVILYALNKHLDKLLPLVAEVIQRPAFPQQELDLFIQNSRNRLQVDLAKNDVVAYRTITEYIFGKKHPYGYNSLPEMYEQLRREDLQEHFQRNYHADACAIFISGKIEKGFYDLLDQYLGQMPRGKRAIKRSFEVQTTAPRSVKIHRPDSVQTAIRIGTRMFNKKHADYHGLFILNAILGGYFGSRLMANIREEKGYTYNIFSTLDTMLADGYFYIGTEVGNEFVAPTITEIYREIERLQTELVKEEELQMVRNYLLGNLLTNLDGPFNMVDVVKSLVLDDLSFAEFDQAVNRIKTIQPEELRQLAQQYFRKDQLWELIVGA